MFEEFAESAAGNRVESSQTSFAAIKKAIRQNMLDPASVEVQQSEIDVMRERLSGWNLVRFSRSACCGPTTVQRG
jgi:hypothetical protein